MAQCPRCGYVRKPEDAEHAPEYECPECRIVYAKALNNLGPRRERKEEGIFNRRLTPWEIAEGLTGAGFFLYLVILPNPSPFVWLLLWPALWVFSWRRIRKKTASKVISIGGGFIASILWMIVFLTPAMISAPKKKPLPPPIAADPPSLPEPHETEIVMNSAWDGSVWQVDKFLQKNLKDPDSLQYIEWGKVHKNRYYDFIVQVKYRAKNSFGGYTIEHKLFLLDATGKVKDFADIRR